MLRDHVWEPLLIRKCRVEISTENPSIQASQCSY